MHIPIKGDQVLWKAFQKNKSLIGRNPEQNPSNPCRGAASWIRPHHAGAPLRINRGRLSCATHVAPWVVRVVHALHGGRAYGCGGSEPPSLTERASQVAPIGAFAGQPQEQCPASAVIASPTAVTRGASGRLRLGDTVLDAAETDLDGSYCDGALADDNFLRAHGDSPALRLSASSGGRCGGNRRG